MAKTKTSTTYTEPSTFQKPYLSYGFSEARKLYGQPIQYFPGKTIAGFSPEQLQAQTLATQRALAGSPEIAAGSQELRGILSGKYLTPESNPYLGYYVSRAYESALPQLDTTAIQAGRYGSGAWGLAKGRTMADIASEIYGSAYQQERQNMLQALNLAPAFSEAAWGDISRLAEVGAEKQQMEQALINEQIARHEFEQMEPWERLANYLNMISGEMGGVTTSYTRGK